MKIIDCDFHPSYQQIAMFPYSLRSELHRRGAWCPELMHSVRRKVKHRRFRSNAIAVATSFIGGEVPYPSTRCLLLPNSEGTISQQRRATDHPSWNLKDTSMQLIYNGLVQEILVLMKDVSLYVGNVFPHYDISWG
jgi:hypothetical protein